MARLKILSIAVGRPNIYDAQWVRIFSIAKGLRDRGHEVDLISYVGRHTFDHLTESVKELNCRLVPTIKADVFYKNVKLVDEFNPDLVFANTHVPAFICGVNKSSRIPIIFDMHGFVVDEIALLSEKKNFLFKYRQILPHLLMERLATRLSDKILCVSHRMMYYLNRMRKVRQDKMEYVTNGVDLNLFKPLPNDDISELRRQLGLDKKLVFGYIGGLQKWQGVDKFVEAARLVKDNKVAFLVIGGDEVWREGNIIKLSQVPRQQLPYYYSLCDVLVLPRPYNMVTEVAAPTKFAEYTAMGKPVLATNVGDAAMFVKKYKCGIVIHNNDPQNLKEAFYTFKDLSESELRRMGENSRKLAEAEFDWNKILAKLDLSITKIIKR